METTICYGAIIGSVNTHFNSVELFRPHAGLFIPTMQSTAPSLDHKH